MEILNKDDEAAFILSDGPSRWRAVASLSFLTIGRHAVWHFPSGPLPLLGPLGSQVVDWVENPWAGWQELRSGFDPTQPYFGAGHPGIFWLNLKNQPQGHEEKVGVSSFEWIGHRYDALGNKASEETERWWKRLGSSTRRVAKKVPRGGPLEATQPEIYALPDALEAFERGIMGANNP